MAIPPPPNTFGQGFHDGFINDFKDLFQGLLSQGQAWRQYPVESAIRAALAINDPGDPIARATIANVRNFTDGLNGAVKSGTVPYFAGNQFGHGAGKLTQAAAADAVAGPAGLEAEALPEVEAEASLEGARGGTARPISTIGGRPPINSRYAGQTDPLGVAFTDGGFADFEPHSTMKVRPDGLTGNGRNDVKLANQAAGFAKTPPGFVWHHVEDGKTMLLVPEEIHRSVGHTGGKAILRNGGVDP